MSFNINFNNNQPMIKEAQKSQDGGAGNTGYFRVDGESEEKKKKQNSQMSIFEEDNKDSFKKEGEDDDEDTEFTIKKMFAKIFVILKISLKVASLKLLHLLHPRNH